MSRRLLAAVAIALLIGLLWYVSPGAAGDPPAKESVSSKESSTHPAKLTPDEWSGKVLHVTSGWPTVALENVQFRQLGDQTFLVGRAVVDEKPQSLPSGRMTWIRFESATQIVEFANVKEYRKAMEAMPAWPVPAVIPAPLLPPGAPAVIPAVPAVPS
jgi:hypothetical protein